jgi:hypothetical protein
MNNQYKDITIDWFGEITSKMGYGLQARRMLKPLIEGGATVKLIPDESYLPDHMKINDPYWNNLIEKSKTLPDSPVRICYCLPTRAVPNPKATNVYYAMWETTQYPREWAQIINNNAQIFWAGCDSLVESASRAGIVVPTSPMYATIDSSTWTKEGNKLHINELKNDDIKFLFIGNFIPRKNLEELIIGFNCAFQGYNDVGLIIKTWSSANNAEGRKHIADAIRHFSNKTTGLVSKPKISLITDILDEDQIINLIRGTDCYVSVSYGEGFDLPMIQAMSMEKLIVTTRFLAHSDYLTDSNSLGIDFSLMPCVNAGAPLYDSYQMWSRPNMESYINKLRESYSLIRLHKEKAQQMGYEARKTIDSKFNVKNNTDYLANSIRKAISISNVQNPQPKKILTKELV